jgi:hypothetical protein
MAVRGYTGTSDARGKIQGRKDAIENMVGFLSYCFGLKKVGTIGDSLTSVHSTGRAFDIRAWNFGKNDWLTTNFEERNWNLINYLYINREYLGVEEIHDYVGLYVSGTMTRYDGSGRGSDSFYGAGYRCNRDNVTELYAPTGWKRWNLESHTSHGGDSVGLKHIHVEMSPAAAKNSTQLISKVDISVRNYFKLNWHSTALAGSGANAYVQATRIKNKKYPIR